MGSNMFWGIFFVVLGVLMLINYVFGMNLPVLRILFSVFIIYIGIKMLFGSFGFETKKVTTDYQAIFSKSSFQFPSKDNKEANNDYQTVFGNGILDLTTLDLSQGPQKMELDNVFGQTTLILKKDTPFKVDASVVFGQISLPDKKMSSIGDWFYQSENYSQNPNHLDIKADVVFGQLVIVFKD